MCTYVCMKDPRVGEVCVRLKVREGRGEGEGLMSLGDGTAGETGVIRAVEGDRADLVILSLSPII